MLLSYSPEWNFGARARACCYCCVERKAKTRAGFCILSPVSRGDVSLSFHAGARYCVSPSTVRPDVGPTLRYGSAHKRKRVFDWRFSWLRPTLISLLLLTSRRDNADGVFIVNWTGLNWTVTAFVVRRNWICMSFAGDYSKTGVLMRVEWVVVVC